MRRGLVNWILIFLGFESKGSQGVQCVSTRNSSAIGSFFLYSCPCMQHLLSLGDWMLRTSKEIIQKLIFKQYAGELY